MPQKKLKCLRSKVRSFSGLRPALFTTQRRADGPAFGCTELLAKEGSGRNISFPAHSHRYPHAQCILPKLRPLPFSLSFSSSSLRPNHPLSHLFFLTANHFEMSKCPSPLFSFDVVTPSDFSTTPTNKISTFSHCMVFH